VYLTVSLSGKGGNAPVYVVGPMSRAACAANSDTIALQLTGNSTTDQIRSKSCAATASDNLGREGCRLSSTMQAIPDSPSAHLWKYDCMAPDAETLAARATTSKAPANGAHHRAAAPTAVAAAAPLAPASPGIEPAPESAASAPKRESNAGDGGSAPAVVDAGDAVGPRPLPVADARPTSTEPTPGAAAADDLAPVRTRDPQAAERIVSYCSKLTSSASNAATVAAHCRRDEMDAWNRLTVQNEFPTLDEASRRKCSDPPFPDSFVALESCAKYQLHLD
jgi:hypothetical protein